MKKFICIISVSYTHLDVYKRQVLTHEECEDILNLPVKSYEEYGEKKAYWLKSPKYNELDRLLNLDEYVRKQQDKLSPMQHEEIDKMKLSAQIKKNNLLHSLDDLNLQMKELEKERESVKSCLLYTSRCV